MRVFADCYELMSEMGRDVLEMGIRVHPASMQNKRVEGNEDFATLEINNYSYCLQSMGNDEYLFIGDKRSKEWCKAEFTERVSGNIYNPGEAWKIREELWEQFLVDGKFDYTYSERIHNYNGLNKIIKELKDNPDTRQAILSIWDPSDIQNIGGKKRVPCSIYYQFLLRNGQLDIIYNQRSADAYTHFGNDVWQAWKLMSFVADHLEVSRGFLYHNIGSLHVYNKDVEKLRKCLKDRI